MDEDLGVFEGLDRALDLIMQRRPESAAELSEAVGVTRSSLSRYRRGKGMPSVGALGRLLRRCGVPLSRLEDLLLEVRGEKTADDDALEGIMPTYLPLGLLVIPMLDKDALPASTDERSLHLHQAVRHYEALLKAGIPGKDKIET